MSIDGARRELKRLREKLRAEDQTFKAAAPPLDEDGLPVWDGGVPLTVEGYMRAMGFDPPDELTPEELEARARLGPYRAIFERLDATEEETVT